MVIIVAQDVPRFNVVQLNVNSDYFVQRHQKRDIQNILQDIQDMSRCQGGCDVSWIMA